MILKIPLRFLQEKQVPSPDPPSARRFLVDPVAALRIRPASLRVPSRLSSVSLRVPTPCYLVPRPGVATSSTPPTGNISFSIKTTFKKAFMILNTV